MPQTLTPTGAPSIFGGVGRLEWSAGNPDDPFPAWQDITAFLRTEDNALQITRGRQSELDQIRASQLTCDLDNTDSRFTFGYTAGPYGSTWTPAKKVRYSETIGLRTFVLFTGWIEYPDISDWKPIGLQYVQLTCTDRLTRLSRGRPFLSALAEYVVFNGGTDLKGYWPMTDAAQSFAGYGPWATALAIKPLSSGTAFGARGQVQYQSGIAPAGGESSGARMTLVGVGSSGRGFIETDTPADFAPAIGASDAVTVVFWFALPATFDPAATSYRMPLFFSGQTAGVQIDMNSSSRTWTLFVNNGTSLPNTNVCTINNEALLPVGVYLNESTLKLELWIGSTRQKFDLTSVTGGAGTFGGLRIGYQLEYDLSHVQVYVGKTWGYTQYLAQIANGYAPLEYQNTGARISTLLDYAGVSSAERAIDPGQSIMQAATLAGLDPHTAIANAVSTERGRGFAAGDGRYVFHDRIRSLNV